MCLRVDDVLTKIGLKGKGKNDDGLFKVWKVFRFASYDQTLRSPYRLEYKWKKGWNESNRYSPYVSAVEARKGSVSYGIHVFLNRKDARLYKRYELLDLDQSTYVVRPVYVKKEDLVAVGCKMLGHYNSHFDMEEYTLKDAVFTKVFLKSNN